ncbi:Transcriptional regulator, LacI family [hydrothermal vent metagenome]|uniref:Transcriptional regulator, LacI family n=1 Tax=hydrothermal vent metagenome TaxID=652676 RepID=A0A3B0TKL4_9ZZZZ
MADRPTILDVADLAGVSIATVSRALHSRDIVSDKTYKAVMSAIAKTGYTQNTAAQNLRQRRANAVLVLVPYISNTYFSEILSGIEQVASSANLTVLIVDTERDHQRTEEFFKYLSNGRADGALLLEGYLPGHVFAQMQKTHGANIPIVTISEALRAPLVPHVGIDNCAAAELAVNHLIGLGHHHIAHLSGLEGIILSELRLKGYHKAMDNAGIARHERQIFSGDFTIMSGENAGRQILMLKDRPSAIFCANDEMAMGLISTLVNGGLGVPRDISVVGFDDIHFSRTFIPALTTIRQPRAQFGKQAAKILLSILKKNPIAASDYKSFKAELVVRQSTAPMK